VSIGREQLNAGEAVDSVALAQALASAVTLVRQRFPAARVNLSPWRNDPQTRRWQETESLDLAFHFPGWSPRLECRSLLMQLRLKPGSDARNAPALLGVLMRGMTYDGERWRLATMGDWEPEGSHLPQPEQVQQLRGICRDLFDLFSDPAATDTAA
jgi:hypothetical protein